jgi:hypothetical protein
LGAMDSMVAHREGYSHRCSSTMRTARSRTSGEKRFDFLLVPPSSQSVEPHQNPGLFREALAPWSQRPHGARPERLRRRLRRRGPAWRIGRRLAP